MTTRSPSSPGPSSSPAPTRWSSAPAPTACRSPARPASRPSPASSRNSSTQYLLDSVARCGAGYLRRVHSLVSGCRVRLAAGDGGHDADGGAVGDVGVDTVEEADVFVGDEHVHEPTQLALVVEQPLTESRVRHLEVGQHRGQRGAFGLDLGGAARELAQLRGDANRYRHAYCSSSNGSLTLAPVRRVRTPRGRRR